MSSKVTRVLGSVACGVVVASLLAGLSWFSLSRDLAAEHARKWRRVRGVDVVEVPSGRRVAGVAWRGDVLWVLTRQASPGEPPDVDLRLSESGWGWRDEVVFKPEDR